MNDEASPPSDPNDARGQAFTLEGLIGSLLVLSAVLFVLQATVFTPTSGGQISDAQQSRLRQQAQDILQTTATADEKDLSYVVRYWDQDRRTFVGGVSPSVGYTGEESRIPGSFGTKLTNVFGDRGNSYNVYVVYQTATGTESVPIVFRGAPPSDASPVVASYRVTLYDNMTLTGPDAGAELWEIDTNATDGDDGYYPVPNAVDGPVYNVVEVRIVVW